MQITGTYHDGLPPSTPGGGTPLPDIASQLREQQQYHKRVQSRRVLAAWWWPILLMLLGCTGAVVAASLAGPLYPNQTLAVGAAALVGIPAFVILVRHLQLGLLTFALVTTTLAGPKLMTIKSLDVYPSEIMILILFCTLLVYVAFRARDVFLPPLRAIWPQVGLFALGIVSNVMVQFTWTHGVPKKLNNNPIIYDQLLGSLAFSFPLIVYVIVTMIVSTNERLIRHIQRIFMIAAMIVAAIVLYDFRRLGGDINSFRFNAPHISWMDMRAVAQLLALGAILGYGRFLYAKSWPKRAVYLAVTLTCFITVILTLENSWWLETLVALGVMTIMFSWRIILFYIVLFGTLASAFFPALVAEFQKLQSVKATDAVRFIIWADSLRVWSKQPIFGVGPGNFWVYDQLFTHLPRALRNCNATGLCVAHNGYLQILGEEGPLGLFFFVAFPIVIIVLAIMLYRRAYVPRKRSHYHVFLSIAGWLGFSLADVPDTKIARAKKPMWKQGRRRRWFIRVGRQLKRGDFLAWVGAVALFFYVLIGAIIRDEESTERHEDRILAMVCIGLTLGSMVADFFAGSFFIPPRQISIFQEMPQVVTSWILWACLMYKDQKWRKICKQAKLDGKKPVAYPDEKKGRVLRHG
ncbi:MAG: O-antigen ligase family protein [Ktedonobacteraceae bacterium]